MLCWNASQLQQLIDSLKQRGYRVLGPEVRDGAMMYGELDSLPVGWGDEQEAGRYKLTARGDQTRFGYNLGPASWKQYLFPPEETLFSVRDGEFVSERQSGQKMAFIGVRACELAALQTLSRVFINTFCDPGYRQRQESLFVVAVNCSQAAATCFCDSTGDGPAVGQGADLVLTEVNPENPYYLVTAHSPEAESLLVELGGEKASAAQRQAGEAAIADARQQMHRELPGEQLSETLLGALDHPHWEQVAGRCLGCGNCTQVCPTCFCSTTEEQVDPVSLNSTHLRKWDSCFTEGHSYVVGGVVHQSVKSRYRQWLTHKLGSWVQQFGVSGCTGCGRCISWCPVGIDLTEETRQLMKAP